MKKFIGKVKEKRILKESVSRILDGREQSLFRPFSHQIAAEKC